MSIVAIKNQLALIVANALEAEGQSIKIIKSNFNEDSDNKPQMSKQAVIKHRQSSLELISSKDGTFRTTYSFDLDLTVKDLRTDDTIQTLVDIVLKSLIGVKFGLIPIKNVVAENQGWNDGIWKYIISFDVTTNNSKDDPDDECKLHGVTDLDFVISLVPSYSNPLRG